MSSGRRKRRISKEYTLVSRTHLLHSRLSDCSLEFYCLLDRNISWYHHPSSLHLLYLGHCAEYQCYWTHQRRWVERGTCYHASHSEFITGTIVVTGSLEKTPDQLDRLLFSHDWNCSHYFLAMGTALPVCTHGDDCDRCDRVRFELQEGMDSTLHGTESSLFHLSWK